MRRALLAALLGLALVLPARAQLDRSITIRARDQDLSLVIQTICSFANLSVVVGPELKGKKVSLDLKDVPAARLLRYLAALYGFGVGFTPDGSTVLAGSKEAIESMDLSTTRVVPLANADAEKMASLLQKLHGGKVQAIADPRTNSVILVTGSGN